MDHRHLDPSITFIWSLSSSLVTENCCYPKALQWPPLQELNTWTQPSFSSMDVTSKPTRSTDSAETLISTHEMERQLRLNQTLYFCELPSPTPHISVFAQLPSCSVKGFHYFYNFMHYCSGTSTGPSTWLQMWPREENLQSARLTPGGNCCDAAGESRGARRGFCNTAWLRKAQRGWHDPRSGEEHGNELSVIWLFTSRVFRNSRIQTYLAQ